MNYSEPFSVVTKNNATLNTISVPNTYKPFFRGGIWVINNYGSTIPAIPTSNGKTTLGYKSSVLTSDSSQLGETFRSTTYPGSSSTNSTVYADYRVVNVMEKDATLELGPQARVVIRMGQKLQTIQIGHFELYNLGTSISADSIPNLAVVPSEKEIVKSGTKLISEEDFYTNSAANASKYATVTKVTDGMGLFAKYVEHVAHKSSDGVAPNASQSSTNYDDAQGKLGFKENMTPGVTVLVKITARAANDDNSEGTMCVVVTDGSMTGASKYGRGITDLVEDRYVLFYGRAAEHSTLSTSVLREAVFRLPYARMQSF